MSPQRKMIAIACVLLSALGFYFSIGLGEQWWLAWFAPVPILWYAFGESAAGRVVLASFATAALGASSLLRAYGSVLPVPVLVLAIGAPSLLFAIAVMGARRVYRVRGPVAATLTFAALWAAFDFLSAFSPEGGAVGTPAAAEVGMPVLIQAASLVGFTGITFLLGLVPAGIAASVRTRKPLAAGIALAVLAASAAYGYWRIAAPPEGFVHVALVESDAAVGSLRKDDPAAAIKAVDAYVAAVDRLQDAQVRLIVLPENIARIAPQWQGEVQSRLAAAATRVHATLVAGFNDEDNGVRRNIAWAFVPGAAAPDVYVKRHLVPVLESAIYQPGNGARVLADGVGLEICKDMDFHAMLRADQIQTQPTLLAVPAWDFGEDGWAHARVAVLRSVENGVPMVRTARDGLLTINDRYGRILSRARAVDGFTVLVGDVPVDRRGGATVYDRIGDVFGWLCLLLGGGLVALGIVRRP